MEALLLALPEAQHFVGVRGRVGNAISIWSSLRKLAWGPETELGSGF